MNKPLTLFVFGWFSLSLSAQITWGPTVSTFAVLGGSTVTNTGATSIGGNLGVSPGTAITGFPPGLVNGTIHSADATAAQAQIELTAAYNTAFNLACPPGNVLTGTDLGGLYSSLRGILLRDVSSVDRNAHAERVGQSKRPVRFPDRNRAHHGIR